jgi:hemerythrin-like domain-containing protein
MAMEAIETLMAEHRVILRVVDALEVFAAGVGDEEDGREELGRFVRFIRGYADALHHGKEEEVLFIAMIDAGFPRESGPVAVMLAEHDVGREHVGILRGLAESVVPWTPEDRDILRGAARAYAELLRLHIRKEDEILYPLAEARLAPPLRASVDEACAALDAKAGSDGTRGRLEQIAAQLAARHATAAGASMGAP